MFVSFFRNQLHAVEHGCRQRSWSRHEKAAATAQTVATARSSERRNGPCRVNSPRSPTGQKKAMAGRGVRDAVHGEVPEALLPQEPGTQHFTLDDDDSVPELGGSRPDPLCEVRPQERVQQHPVDQIVDTAPALPILDVPVPLMGEQLVDVLRFFDTLCPVAEQVIAVPKISLEDVPMRAVLRDPQLVEQLVEVPTIVSYSWLQLGMAQNVDTPVPRRGERISGLQGFLPGQSSTALHSSEERISERIVEQNVAFPAGGGLQDFLPGLSSSASSSSPAGVHGSADGPGEGFFALFPPFFFKKKRDVGLALGVGTAPESSPSTPAAHVDTWVDGDEVWIRIDSVHGQFWKRLLSDHVQWQPPWERQ